MGVNALKSADEMFFPELESILKLHKFLFMYVGGKMRNGIKICLNKREKSMVRSKLSSVTIWK